MEIRKQTCWSLDWTELSQLGSHLRFSQIFSTQHYKKMEMWTILGHHRPPNQPYCNVIVCINIFLMIGTIGMIIIPIMGIFGQVGRGKRQRSLTGFHLSHVTSAWVSAFLKHAITVSNHHHCHHWHCHQDHCLYGFCDSRQDYPQMSCFGVNPSLIASLSNTI